MGFNTALMFCNDGIDQIRKYPDDFVEGILEHMRRGGTFGVGNHGGIVTVHPTAHADDTQLIAVGGNFSTRLLHTYWARHHTPDGQVELLRRWADSLGYRISRKPGTATEEDA